MRSTSNALHCKLQRPTDDRIFATVLQQATLDKIVRNLNMKLTENHLISNTTTTTSHVKLGVK